MLYETARTRVSRFRLRGAAGSLIVKEPLGPGALARTRHELRILRLLAGVPGVVQLAAGRGQDELVLEDLGGDTLAALIQDEVPDVGACLELAVELATTVGAMHRLGVMHKDINPANLLVSGSRRQPVLIDFGLASTFGEELPRFAHPREIVGTLPYLAPEQTGRTGMSVDERADLYALGATLYELATGGPPFGAGDDPLRLVRDALATMPVAPADRDDRVPGQLSDIIMRLLEKEPDRRYQSAEGLTHDLSRLRDDLAHGRHESFALGERDFPLRLSAPSRLVGRDVEVGILRRAFDDALTGGSRGVLVAGAPGVGKTALVNELRSPVTASGGVFVSGKFDQHRQDAQSGAVTQALRALGRLLLAGTEAELADTAARIRGALGTNLPLAATLPEFAAVLGVAPDKDLVHAPGGDAREAATRLQQTLLDLLGAVASPQRPVVIVIDDLQWAGADPVGFVDAVLTNDRLTGVLLVGIYRDQEVDAAHPLTTALARWERLGSAPTLVRLENLPPTSVSELLADMLRLPSLEAADLADVVGARTGGNPYDTVELVNALRGDGALVVGEGGWSWDRATIRRFVGKGDVVDLLAARIARLPHASRELLDVMTCLGGEVELDLMTAASGLSVEVVTERLVTPLENGLLVLEESDPPAVRFRHDRVQQAAYSRMAPRTRKQLHLEAARRLATAPGRGPVAAEQYLHSVGAVRDPDERRVAAGLLVETAKTVRVLNPSAAERFLTAAMALLDGAGTAADEKVLSAAERLRHGVLYSLGRLEEADTVYASIERRCDDPVDLGEPTCDQVASLTNRGQQRAAVELGMALLSQLGVDVPDGAFDIEMERRGDELATWASALVLSDDLGRPETESKRVRVVAKLISRLLPASFFCEPAITAWLISTSRLQWVEHGPCAPLVANLGAATLSTVMLRNDYRTGYAIAKHAMAIGEARGYEPEASFVRHAFSVLAQHWFEPLEDTVHQSQRAREGLIHGGDLHEACFSHFTSLAGLLDSSPTLESCADDVESALAFAARTGNDHGTGCFLAYRQLLLALRGQTASPGSFSDDAFDEAEHLAQLDSNPMAAAYFHINRALSAALFGDAPSLIRHAAAAMPLLPYLVAFYTSSLGQLLQGLALAERVRTASPGERPTLLAELDVCRAWLTARATDAPVNFGHLVALLTAERAWAVGETWEAARAFDTARREVADRRRPWHQALITERAARFHLASGLQQSGRDLLGEARQHYAAWCATGKVSQLDEDRAFLRSPATRPSAGRASSHPVPHSSSLSGDTIDMLAILQASQALSAETSPYRLRAHLGELLQAMTGATTVLIALRHDESDDWRLWDTTGGTADGLPVAEAAPAGLLPLSAFRYVERTREPLVVEDATCDDRFSRDQYLTALDRCSLLVVPILSQGLMRAVLVLENTLRRGAFAADRLDAVMLVTGQLAVSLDNAQLYASLEGKVAERTAALEEANLKLEVLSNTDALTGLPNRRHFDTTIEAEWRRAVRQGTPLGLAMIDVDNFKPYNDHYGHLAGDECLNAVANAFRDGLRSDPDVVCRYGGEEFAAILPGTDEATALVVAERVREAVESLRRPHVVTDGSIVTVSIGVASCVPGESITTDELIATADLGLYRAKMNGRNRVCSGQEPTSDSAEEPDRAHAPSMSRQLSDLVLQMPGRGPTPALPRERESTEG